MAQVDIDPTIEPAFFGPEDEITITYDVTNTQLESLSEAWIWMWLPDENIDAPSNINPANSNPAATNPAKFTKSTDDGKVTFSITLTPTDFFDQSASDIETIGMLLKGNDWSNGQTDDFLVDVTSGYSLLLESPSGSFGFYDPSENISIVAKTSEPSAIDVFVDGSTIDAAVDVTELTTSHTAIDDGEVHEIKVTASNGTETLEAIHTYAITPSTTEETLPESMVDGINYGEDNTSATLVLRAPNKENVFVIGDFNDWTLDDNYLMKRDGDQFWIEITGLEESKEYIYQYLVDGEIRIADPYAEKISSPFDDDQIIQEDRYPDLKPYPSDKTTEAAGYLQTNQPDFDWSPFTKPNKEDLVIYELLIRDFTEERTYDAAMERLDYLADLGINAIELMPVMEFEGNLSWGYNPSFMFAVDKYYGTELDLKTFIDEAHKRGIAIILDIVHNHHFGRSSLVRLYNEGLYGKPTPENPWLNVNPTHDFNVGYDFNHESQLTKSYIDRVNRYWIEEYNIDGYRFDLSKGFTQKNTLGDVGLWGQYDPSRVAILKRMVDEIWSVDPDTYIILEHLAENDEEKELANYGMMLWGNMNHTFRNAAKGTITTLSGLYHENRDWNEPHLVGYMESHDEERLMWDLLNGSRTKSEALKRAKLASVFFFMVPGPKMMWQFGEMGYDEELNNDRLGIKPTHWEYLNDPARYQLFALYKSLINLRTKTDYIDENHFEWNTSGWIKWITIDHPDVKFHAVGNFDSQEQTANYNFPQTGTWYDYFTGEEFQISDANQEFTLPPGHFSIFVNDQIENYIDVNPLTSVEENHNYFSLYPNPSNSNGAIRVSSTHNITDYKVFDLLGKPVNVQIVDGKMDTSVLKKGMYIISVQVNGEWKSKKFILK